VLLPFATDGLRRGDRVIHIVEDRAAYLRRLERRADISGALESGQLDVRTWDTSYIADGRFSAPGMLAFIRRTLREGRPVGSSAIRLIGDMEWAQDGVPGVEDLVAYESGVDALVARPDTWVVCAYDVRRHSASRITQILGAHQAAFTAGRLQQLATSGEASTPRERILAAAALLFAENGVTRTGVDMLIAAAGVAKATFYRHFPSKEALVLAWLRDPRTRWFDRVRAQAEARAVAPDDQVLRFFEALAEWLEADDFIGCAYLNTSVETSNPADAVSAAIHDYLAEIERYLQGLVAAAGYSDAERLGTELHTLVAGSIMLGVANRTTANALAARDTAARVLAR
jgi:AcrR family transcriptional regulator